MMQIFNFFGNIFGYLLWFLYTVFENYGIAIILFTLIIKVLMFPSSLNQQKNMAKQRKMTEKQQELQKKYEEKFKKPEAFLKMGRSIMAIPTEPTAANPKPDRKAPGMEL